MSGGFEMYKVECKQFLNFVKKNHDVKVNEIKKYDKIICY